MFQYFPYLVFTITDEESPTTIPILHRGNLSLGLLKGLVQSKCILWIRNLSPVLPTPISRVSSRFLSVKFIRSSRYYEKCDLEIDGRKEHLVDYQTHQTFSASLWKLRCRDTVSRDHTTYSETKGGQKWLSFAIFSKRFIMEILNYSLK